MEEYTLGSKAKQVFVKQIYGQLSQTVDDFQSDRMAFIKESTLPEEASHAFGSQ